jgi:hypothetical protein
VLELVVLRLRPERSKELEILVLRHQLHVVQRQVARPRLRPVDRPVSAALSRSLPRPAWASFFVSPVTLCVGTVSWLLDVFAPHRWQPEDGQRHLRTRAAAGA